MLPYGDRQAFVRSDLSDSLSTADKLVYSHETIHLPNKLQDAGWEAEVVAHESKLRVRLGRGCLYDEENVAFGLDGSLARLRIGWVAG